MKTKIKFILFRSKLIKLKYNLNLLLFILKINKNKIKKKLYFTNI
jgi:hypothetical protein